LSNPADKAGKPLLRGLMDRLDELKGRLEAEYHAPSQSGMKGSTPLSQGEHAMNRLVVVLMLGLGILGHVGHGARADKEKEPKKVDMRVFELRTYTAAPGKMKDLDARFRNHTNKPS
jgi:hypothetical protein